MSDQQLVGILYAIAVVESKSMFESSPERSQKAALQKVFNYLSSSLSITFETSLLTECDHVDFNTIKDLIDSVDSQKSLPSESFYDRIEKACWNFCEQSLDYIRKFSNNEKWKVWQIVNRVIDKTVYPPSIPQKTCIWLAEILLGRKDKVPPARPFTDVDLSFEHFLIKLQNIHVNRQFMELSLSNLHQILVEGIIQSGLVLKRERRNGDCWGTWRQRWCVLLPWRLEFYAGHQKRKIISEMRLRKSTNIRNLNIARRNTDYKYGIKVVNGRVIELEIAFKTEKQRDCWLANLSFIIQSLGEETGMDAHSVTTDFLNRKRRGHDMLPNMISENSSPPTIKPRDDFVQCLWQRRNSVRVSKIRDATAKHYNKQLHTVTEEDFRRFILVKNLIQTNSQADAFNPLEIAFRDTFGNTVGFDLFNYIQGRWLMFLKFRRQDAAGNVVMKCGHGMVEKYNPGKYDLTDLARFQDISPLEPKYTVIKNVQWKTSPDLKVSGTLLFPPGFDGQIQSDIATNENVSFYGCSFADRQKENISLRHTYWINDFTYDEKYLSDYVLTYSACGLEKHEFAHLDCPLDDDSGHLILGKLTPENELYVTAFRIPTRHTIYIPPFCIHSNDYMNGTWRTMLSDETDIDHVCLTTQNSEGMYRKFRFKIL